MSDSYIDPFETIIYGAHARDMLAAHAIGPATARDKRLAATLDLVIDSQEHADNAMQAVIAKMPTVTGDEGAITKAQDALVRFGSFIGSLEGRPLDAARFFGSAQPSQIGKRRGPKMIGALQHVIDELAPFASAKKPIEGVERWLKDLTRIHSAAAKVVSQKTKAKVEQRELSPAVANARSEWLAVYGANKSLVEGVLRHLGKGSLMDVIFDDLAEVQHSTSKSASPVAPVDEKKP